MTDWTIICKLLVFISLVYIAYPKPHKDVIAPTSKTILRNLAERCENSNSPTFRSFACGHMSSHPALYSHASQGNTAWNRSKLWRRCAPCLRQSFIQAIDRSPPTTENLRPPISPPKHAELTPPYVTRYSVQRPRYLPSHVCLPGKSCTRKHCLI